MTKALKLKPIQPEVEDYSPKLEVVQDRENSYDSQLENEFKLKSEFFEKNVSVDQSFLQDQKEDYTQVKIYREGGIDIIDPRALKEFIATHKGINQVVIEKISLNEATRVSLLFEPLENGEEMSTLLEDQIRPHLVEQSSTEELSTDKSFSLDELETLVNQDFFGRPVVESMEEKSDILPKSKLSFDFPTEQPAEKGFTPRLVEDGDTRSEVQGNDKGKDQEGASSGLNLKLKGAGAIKGSKQLNYEKHTLTRKKNKSGNAFYYRAKDHMELYKVGSSYLKDFNSGLKSFSFASCGLDLQREKSVLGITSFFNYHEDINICVVTRDIAGSFYSAIAENLSVKAREIFDEDLTYDVHHAGGFDLVELSELKKVERKLRNYDFEHFLDHLLDSYDLILWDLPALEVLDSNKELYFPIIRSLDNVSFIVGKNKSKVSEINSMVSYFKRYQIQIKGLLFSEESPKGGAK